MPVLCLLYSRCYTLEKKDWMIYLNQQNGKIRVMSKWFSVRFIFMAQVWERLLIYLIFYLYKVHSDKKVDIDRGL